MVTILCIIVILSMSEFTYKCKSQECIETGHEEENDKEIKFKVLNAMIIIINTPYHDNENVILKNYLTV